MESLISLQLVFLTVLFCIHCTNAASCKTGEPTNVESDNTVPDLNITLSPGLVVRVGDKVTITCTADKPRFQFSTFQALRPTQVSVFTPEKITKSCNPLNDCVQTTSITLTKAGKNFAIACRAQNSDGGFHRIK